jgi:hypothetical protein
MIWGRIETEDSALVSAHCSVLVLKICKHYFLFPSYPYPSIVVKTSNSMASVVEYHFIVLKIFWPRINLRYHPWFVQSKTYDQRQDSVCDELWFKGNIFIMDLLGSTYVEYCVQKINICAPSAQVLVKNFMNWGFSWPLSCNLLSKLPIDRKSPFMKFLSIASKK